MLAGNPQASVLVCRLAEKPEIVASQRVAVVRSLVACMSQATAKPYGFMVILFSTRQISSREGLLELCACLRQHELTRQPPLFVWMDCRHRRLGVRLKEVGVEYIGAGMGKEPFDPGVIRDLVEKKDLSVCVERVLSRWCQFLNYTPIDRHRELITCLAYGNRMVLGGKRLHEVCEAHDHLQCGYFSGARTEA